MIWNGLLAMIHVLPSNGIIIIQDNQMALLMPILTYPKHGLLKRETLMYWLWLLMREFNILILILLEICGRRLDTILHWEPVPLCPEAMAVMLAGLLQQLRIMGLELPGLPEELEIMMVFDLCRHRFLMISIMEDFILHLFGLLIMVLLYHKIVGVTLHLMSTIRQYLMPLTISTPMEEAMP